MSTKKYLTAKEMFAALLDGKKIKSEDWSDNEYCFIDDHGDLVDECGDQFSIYDLDCNNMVIYEEPKKKVELFLWANQATIDSYYKLDVNFMTEETAKLLFGDKVVKTNCSITVEVEND